MPVFRSTRVLEFGIARVKFETCESGVTIGLFRKKMIVLCVG
jgi:hypothetical protein